MDIRGYNRFCGFSCKGERSEMEVRRSYKYRIYRASRNKRLYQSIDISGIIWNHSIALQRRYYRLTGKYINQSQLKSQLAKLRRSSPKYRYWQKVGSQSVQDVIGRLEKSVFITQSMCQIEMMISACIGKVIVCHS